MGTHPLPVCVTGLRPGRPGLPGKPGDPGGRAFQPQDIAAAAWARNYSPERPPCTPLPQGQGRRLSLQPLQKICWSLWAMRSQGSRPEFQGHLPPGCSRMCHGALPPQCSSPPQPALGPVRPSVGSESFRHSRRLSSPGMRWPSFSPLDSQPLPSQAALEAHSVISFQCVLYCFDCLFL